MIARCHYGYLAFFLCHFFLISTICLHETLRLLTTNVVSIKAMPEVAWKTLDKIPAAIVADEADSPRLWRSAVATYTNAAGIEAGYGYFAPNIPPGHALVFEFHYRDGRADYGTPVVGSEAARIRLTTLLEQIAHAELPEWREELIKLLARSSWRLHPKAISVRAFFGSLTPPTLEEYKAGARERIFNCQYVYDFDESRAVRPGREGAKGDSLSLSR